MYGATCATTLRLKSDTHGTRRIVIADSWFENVKITIALKECGLYSVVLVKTAHRRFPRESGLHILLIWMVLNYRQ